MICTFFLFFSALCQNVPPCLTLVLVTSLSSIGCTWSIGLQKHYATGPGFEPSSYLTSDHSHHLHPPQPFLQALFIQSAHFHVDGVACRFILKCFWSGAVLRLSEGVASLPLLPLCCLGDDCGSWSLVLMVCDQQLVCRMFCRRLLMKVMCVVDMTVSHSMFLMEAENNFDLVFFSPMVYRKLWLFCFFFLF